VNGSARNDGKTEKAGASEGGLCGGVRRRSVSLFTPFYALDFYHGMIGHGYQGNFFPRTSAMVSDGEYVSNFFGPHLKGFFFFGGREGGVCVWVGQYNTVGFHDYFVHIMRVIFLVQYLVKRALSPVFEITLKSLKTYCNQRNRKILVQFCLKLLYSFMKL